MSHWNKGLHSLCTVCPWHVGSFRPLTPYWAAVARWWLACQSRDAPAVRVCMVWGGGGGGRYLDDSGWGYVYSSTPVFPVEHCGDNLTKSPSIKKHIFTRQQIARWRAKVREASNNDRKYLPVIKSWIAAMSGSPFLGVTMLAFVCKYISYAFWLYM